MKPRIPSKQAKGYFLFINSNSGEIEIARYLVMLDDANTKSNDVGSINAFFKQPINYFLRDKCGRTCLDLAIEKFQIAKENSSRNQCQHKTFF